MDDWHKIYSKLKELNLDLEMDILPYIFGDKHLIFDDLEMLKDKSKGVPIAELEKITPRKHENFEKVLTSNIGMKQYQQIKNTKTSELNKKIKTK